MTENKKLTTVLAAVMSLALVSTNLDLKAWARGGGGGGRGGGFGGGRGYGDRGYESRDFGDRGFDNGRADDFGSRIDQSYYPHDDAFQNMGHVSDSDLRSAADHDYADMPTDGGFGRVANLRADNSVNNGATLNRITPAQMAMRGDLVRDNYRDYGAFDRGWWGDHPGCWGWGYGGGWPTGWAWGGSDWPALAGYWGMAADSGPTEYDYGNNITYQNDNVYYGSQPVESTGAYYDQAQTLAETYPVPTVAAKPKSNAKVSAAAMAKLKASPTQGKDWKPLGVFSLTQGGQSDTTIMFQLAVNKKGAVGGNYYNVLTKEARPVHGAVDKKNMRVAWTIGTNKDVVYDTGLANLLKDQSSILVHLDKKQTQQWTLTKLQQPQKSST